MNLAFHLLKKDIRRTRVMLSVWLVLVVLQCALIGAGINPGDRVKQAIFTGIAVLVPLFQLLMLVVVIPLVVQEEPLVGTTAFWFTRPISRFALLKSKALFVLGVLVLPPLVAEIVVLAANGATLHDLFLAAPEIVLQQLAFIFEVAILAAVTANFGRFAVLGVVVLVAALLLRMGIFWFGLLLHPENMMNQAQDFSLTQSRSVVCALLTVLAGGAVIAHQYLTRNTMRTAAGAILVMAAFFTVQSCWPWDFLKPQEVTVCRDANFNAGAVKISLALDVTASDEMNIRGHGPSRKSIQSQIETPGVPKGYIVEVKSVNPHLNSQPDGSPVEVSKAQTSYCGGEPDAEAIELALGGTPVVNGRNYGRSYYSTPLFTIDADTYNKNAAQPFKFTADIDLVASRYVVTAEMPLVKGSRYDQGSEHVVVTDVLQQPDGLDLVLQQRKLNLLFAPRADQAPEMALNRRNVIYVLLNKKRREAVVQKQGDFGAFAFHPSSTRLVNQPVRLSFGADPNRSQPTPDLTREWLADAVLERLELTRAASFSKQLVVDQFKLAGATPSISHRYEPVRPDLEALGKISLPQNAAREQVKEYINAVTIASRKQSSYSDKDPQTGMLEKVGPENLDLLIAAANRFRSDGAHFYMSNAIKRLVRPEDEALILQSLADEHDLAEIVVKFGWQPDARDTLISGLAREKHYLPADWIKAVASLQDPSSYPALRSYLVNGNNKRQTFDSIRQLPGFDAPGAVDEMWQKARHGSRHEAMNEGICEIAAEYGHLDALDMAAGILETEKNQWELKQARRVITKFTEAAGDDPALVAWCQGRRDKLVFDPQSGKFVLK